MGFDPAELAERAASLRAAGAVMDRPKSHFKVTSKHIGKRSKAVTDGEHDRDWWLDYEMQNA